MEQTQIDLKAVLKKERLYVAILAAIQVAHILDFVIMMPLGPQFMRVFNISTSEFSTLVSSYTFSAAIVGLFGALYADQFDRKKYLLFNFIGFIFGTFICAVAQDYQSLLIGRIVAGAFGGILNACVLSLVSDLIPFERRGKAMGIVMSSFSIASVAGIPLGLYIANLFDWHATFYFICIVGAFFWILSLLILPPVKLNQNAKSLWINILNLKMILSQPLYIISFLFTSFLSFGIFIVVPFISPYMVKNIGLQESELPLIYLVGGGFTIISAQIIGKLCDKVGSYKVFRYLATISILPILIVTNLPPVPLAIALISTTFFMMFGSGRFIPAMTIISAVVRQRDRGTFMSLENSSRQLFAGAASSTAGLILGISTTGNLTNYHFAGYISIGAVIVALVLAKKLKDRFHLR